MKIRNIVLAGLLATLGAGVFAQAKEQFFPSLTGRTGPVAPNATAEGRAGFEIP